MKCVFAIFLIAYLGHSNMSSIELNFKNSSGGSHKSKTGGFHIKPSWSGEVKSDVLQCGAKLHGFLHGHGSWLVSEVALSGPPPKGTLCWRVFICNLMKMDKNVVYLMKLVAQITKTSREEVSVLSTTTPKGLRFRIQLSSSCLKGWPQAQAPESCQVKGLVGPCKLSISNSQQVIV